ncbi:hypothetical protein PHYSODRAFT_288731 [Phytophthora sojae]|uniref:RxLR effector protein n=2 Tax=Phytophthora sojae TaxID=67593 RepID=G5A575_PHYSP|nr:hypothetical protein PHYSODRAFT_288731 [Phytophthora sojae]AEK81288.1 Avh380 [Phytophthora sojae]AEK81289.1 Avh380 [Phytophthora sojae]AEK81290.1 Avh380 [Phytophthora sojae]EGZ09260.1 hypothetical protein PHYSODRAFT_288731 [Phytophthora sojae]|eukprot:XP_009535893.1 hypothetical protein PHYSODRAFT_288731 [Phytophthora sojae]
MSVKLRLRQVVRSARLFFVLALAACIGGSLATTDSNAIIEKTSTQHRVHQLGTQTHRYLRAPVQLTLGDSEERGLDGISKIIQKLTPDKQKAADKLFTRLKLDTATSNAFKSPKFEKWVASVTSSYKKTPEAADAAIFSRLSTKVGDEALAGMLLAAKEESGTKALASRLETLQLTKEKVEAQREDSRRRICSSSAEERHIGSEESSVEHVGVLRGDAEPEPLHFAVFNAGNSLRRRGSSSLYCAGEEIIAVKVCPQELGKGSNRGVG